MRLYSFVNYYLSPLQHGLQTAHMVSELFRDRITDETNSRETQMLDSWAKYHKTIIICNGGNQLELQSLFDFFVNKDNLFPFSYFTEDEQSLNGCLTCVGIVLPERIYAAMAAVREGVEFLGSSNDYYLPITDDECCYLQFTRFEKELVERLAPYRLA